ncbi:hypothetical protein BJ742DRAFT_839396 [Cladochytrium replicatum]|nr:hypothetical protein BJ742DRAFT_839396 [Cladochytrium replicatum]
MEGACGRNDDATGNACANGATMSFSFLPEDVLIAILDHIHTTTDLHACMLLCRRLHIHAFPRLYRKVLFTSHFQRKKFFALPHRMSDIFGSSNLVTEATNMLWEMAATPEERAGSRVRMLVREIDFGFGPRPGSEDVDVAAEDEEQLEAARPLVNHDLRTRSNYGRAWSHRFVSPELHTIRHLAPRLESLNLRGCQFFDSVLVSTLSPLSPTSLPFPLKHLDLSFSSVKSLGLSSIVSNTLQCLLLDGIFKFGRQRTSELIEIVLACPRLRVLSLLESPLVYANVRESCIEERRSMLDAFHLECSTDGIAPSELTIFWSGRSPTDRLERRTVQWNPVTSSSTVIIIPKPEPPLVDSRDRCPWSGWCWVRDDEEPAQVSVTTSEESSFPFGTHSSVNFSLASWSQYRDPLHVSLSSSLSSAPDLATTSVAASSALP